MLKNKQIRRRKKNKERSEAFESEPFFYEDLVEKPNKKKSPEKKKNETKKNNKSKPQSRSKRMINFEKPNMKSG
jgi:hypothetical protein